MSATEEIILTGVNGRSGHEGISAMVEKWQQQRDGLNPDSPAVDWDEQQMRTIYNTGRSNAATALGRGGENKRPPSPRNRAGPRLLRPAAGLNTVRAPTATHCRGPVRLRGYGTVATAARSGSGSSPS
ncbi:hypothetical protein ACIRRH_28820 [Kitasatospora sp. NPDC101235]|uniref:hypothetical protein n=1 Tax=Kitasatospora sp. NPDC101235 TaxID=3364101 RepID=UPI0038233C54